MRSYPHGAKANIELCSAGEENQLFHKQKKPKNQTKPKKQTIY
jgi:hypothetical protein